jgi:hypothetical protein
VPRREEKLPRHFPSTRISLIHPVMSVFPLQGI